MKALIRIFPGENDTRDYPIMTVGYAGIDFFHKHFLGRGNIRALIAFTGPRKGRSYD